ncbi:type III secretion system translocator chaperone SicA [Escherichia coli]|nr:type III secretion system translocator chaperone SicA [Escherichia coli]
MTSKDMSDILNEDGVNDKEFDVYSDNLLDAIQNGATLKDIHQVSNDTMQGVYQLAYDFYYHGKLDDAESLFRFLCIYDFYNPEYAMGLAAVYQLKKNYAKAIDFYALAYSLSKDDYRPMLYAGQCNLMLRQTVQARRCFDIVINRCSDSVLSEKAKVYLSVLDEVKREEAQSPEKGENINED